MSYGWNNVDKFTPIKMEYKWSVRKSDIIIEMVNKYFMETGNNCFEYKDLRIWMYSNPKYKKMEWHTVERFVRMMASQKALKRVWIGKKRVKFCKTY